MNSRNPQGRTMADYALSLKQPWAALLVHGVKTIEIRRWPTARRGLVYIHAARIPDDRPEGWAMLPSRFRDTAELRGGLIGAAQLTGCKLYREAAVFTADRSLHLNDPSWFDTAGLYGFTFERPQVLPFRRYPGWFRFFKVKVAAP
jgi:hypothetical protein